MWHLPVIWFDYDYTALIKAIMSRDGRIASIVNDN